MHAKVLLSRIPLCFSRLVEFAAGAIIYLTVRMKDRAFVRCSFCFGAFSPDENCYTATWWIFIT